MGKLKKGRGGPITPPYSTNVLPLEGNMVSGAISIDDTPDRITHFVLHQPPRSLQLWLQTENGNFACITDIKDTFANGKPKSLDFFFLHNGRAPLFTFDKIDRSGKRAIKCTRINITLATEA